MIIKTNGPIHFTDLSPERFESLVLQIIYRMRRWERLDHVGAGGSDNGIDISATERLENGKCNVHHFQCKRYERLSKSQITKIVADYAVANKDLADYYYLVCGCNPSKKAIDGFENACESIGLKHFAIWSASYLETLLYSDYHDLLFAFLGVNMVNKRNSATAAIRRNLELKKRMHADFQKNSISDRDLHSIRYNGDRWLKFKHNKVLIRSIYDKNYPNNSTGAPGYYKAEIYDWYHNGLEVRAYPYAVDAKIKRLKDDAEDDSQSLSDFEIMDFRLDVFGCIPFENIIAYDIDGDEYYNYPHLFCDYPCGSDPYESIRYRTQNGFIIDEQDIIEFYEINKSMKQNGTNRE